MSSGGVLGCQVDMEERFCQKVKSLGCTCITISHRPALMAFHDIVLALDGEGGWSLHRGARGGRPSLEEGGSPADAAPGASSLAVCTMLRKDELFSFCICMCCTCPLLRYNAHTGITM